MVHAERATFSVILTGTLLVTCLLPDFLDASPVGKRLKGDGGDNDLSLMKKSEVLGSARRLQRSRRNINWYNQHSDFWNWYKYFSDTGNQEGVNELDRMYLKYLQNKNRAEGMRSYDLYLRHLGDIYKACANSDNPNCISDMTGRSKPDVKPTTPPAPQAAPVKGCDPYRDPYCQVMRVVPQAPAPYKTFAPPAPPAGYYYITAPAPFLSAQQKSELARICSPTDVECLQYHLRAAYGYTSGSASPSYAFLGCDPKKDPYCLQKPAKDEPYHRYPNCDPNYDPYCVPERQSPAPLAQSSSTSVSCNPLFDDNCNPLTATKFLSEEQRAKDEPAPENGCDPRYDPYCNLPSPSQSDHTGSSLQRYPMTKGKTKEGYDCYINYDEECYPVRQSQPSPAGPLNAARSLFDCDPSDPRCPLFSSRRRSVRDCDPSYDPNCQVTNSYSNLYPQIQNSQQNCNPYFDPNCRQSATNTQSYHPYLNPDGYRDGVYEPDEDCDPEYDRNCRLRRREEKNKGPASESTRHERSDTQGDNEQMPAQDEPRHGHRDTYEDKHTSERIPAEDPYREEEARREDPYHRYDETHEGSENEYPKYEESQGGYEQADDSTNDEDYRKK
ncbi:actinodin1 [Polypterus senegalus]|uniref:actinodin1 n=1 Tax=Polypterus senegalus TaxID=55291 RepID=UPI001964D21D|nr:actinodin1 [Polypterus senegalus]